MKTLNTIFAIALAGLVPQQISAETVKLFSPDGQIEVIGTLVETTDDSFILQSTLGVMTFDRDSVMCEGAACPSTEIKTADVVVRGSDTIGEELFPLLVEGYANQQRAAVADRIKVGPDTTQLFVKEDRGFGDQMMVVEVQAAGSSTGFSALLDGAADIGMSSRPAKSREVDAMLAKGFGNLEDINQEYIIAVDSILMIVSPDNPISELSIEQAGQLFSGNIQNWSELGGPDLPVTVYTRPKTSGTRAVFEGAVLSGNQQIAENATVVSSNTELSEMVTNDPGGIGYVGFASQRNSKAVDLTLSCGIASKATKFAAKTEEYVLQRRLRLYVAKDNANSRAQELLDFSISKDADGLVRQAGFIDLGVTADENGLDKDALLQSMISTDDLVSSNTLRNMIVELQDAARLSTTFRFTSGSSRLDNKAQRDISRMIEFLSRPENADKQIMVVGFTDSDGAFSSNEALSNARAASVVAAIRSHPDWANLGDRSMNTFGFGELAPVGCNDDFQGRYRNRRVEIWLK